MAQKTYAVLMAQVRSRLDESAASFWLDAEIITWLYEGARDVARKTESIRATDTFTQVVNQQEYTLADGVAQDIVRITRLEQVNTGDTQRRTLEYRDFHSMDSVWWTQQNVTRDTPQFFTTWGMPPALIIAVYPTPSVAGTFKMFYYRLPADPAGSGAATCEIAEGWEDVVVDYATYMAMLKDANPNWQAYKAQYIDRLQDLYVTAQRFTDQAGMVDVDTGMAGVPRFIWDEGY